MILHELGLEISFGATALASAATHSLAGPVDAQRDTQSEDFRPVRGEATALDRGGEMWTISFTTAQRFGSFAEALAEWVQQIETGVDEAGPQALTLGGAVFSGAVCQRFRPRIDADFPEVLLIDYTFRTGKGEIA